MADDILEFCKECGLQLPRGLDVCICSLLELEDLQVSQGCFNCGKKYSEHDEWFWDYYSEDFDGASWFSVEHVSCRDCIMKHFNLDHPDYEDSGLRPDTFLVWKEGLQIGVDLGPRLAELENSNSIRRLSDSWVFREEIVKWLNSDCPVDEAEEWASVVDNFDEAMAWRNAGFGPDEESTGNWLRWKCSPETAAKYVEMGIEYVPGVHYIELGVSLEDAVFFELNGFSDHVDDSGRYFVGVWLSSELSPQQILSLRDHIVENEEVFQKVFEKSERRLKFDEMNFILWEALPKQFEQLKSVGLPINPENLLKYWGLSSKEILKVIDAGGAPGVAADAIRHGASVSKLGIIERLVELGAASSTATVLAKRGFLIKHLKQIEKKKDLGSAFEWIARVLESDGSIKVDEALIWLDAEARVSEVKMWRQHGFSAQEAAKWANEGYSPEMAKRWRDAGADSPVVAKRRRDAGLNP
jgi:hypothetical protein